MDDISYSQIPMDDNNLEINLTLNNNAIKISKSTRWFVYILFIISNIFITLDHGSIPASTWNLYKIFNSNQEIGLFGSLVFVGNLLGSLLYFYLINVIHRKKLLLYSMIALSICLITFILTKNTLFLLSNRIILGIFQSYVIIYLPLWCNQYGITNKRSIMLSFGQLTVPIGVFVGYLIASICITIDDEHGWKYAFVIQSVAVFLMIIPFYFAPDSVFESRYESFKDDKSIDATFFKMSNSIIDDPDPDPDATMNELLNITYLPKKQIIDILKEIWTHKIYVLSVFALSCLYFCVTGLQYWGSDYMNRVLGIHSPEKRLLYFSIICFSSPTLGVIMGGYIVNYLQGYEDRRVYSLCFFLSIMTFINAILSILFTKIISFIIFTWLALLFGGAIMPTLTGIVITSLPQHLRASGNSLQLFIGTLFGYLPAPYVYGAIQDIFKDGGRRSMFFNMIYLSICVVLLGFTKHRKYNPQDALNLNLDFTQELNFEEDLKELK